MEQRLPNLYGGALPIEEDRAEPVGQVWLFRLVVGLFVASRVVGLGARIRSISRHL